MLCPTEDGAEAVLHEVVDGEDGGAEQDAYDAADVPREAAQVVDEEFPVHDSECSRS